MVTKIRFVLALALFTLCSGCGSAGVATFVAAMGISGAGLAAYCAAGGSGCSSALLSYSALITTEASKDAVILESGQATVQQLQEIVANLNVDLNQGRALVGLTTGQQNEVSAIVSSVNALLPLVVALTTSAPQPTPAKATALVAAPQTIKIPALSSNDRRELAKMRAAIAALR